MKILGKNGLGNILKIILQICFWGGIAFLIILPIILKRISIFEIMLYLNGITMLVIVKQFIGLFDSLKIEKPFCEKYSKKNEYSKYCIWDYDSPIFYRNNLQIFIKQ